MGPHNEAMLNEAAGAISVTGVKEEERIVVPEFGCQGVLKGLQVSP